MFNNALQTLHTIERSTPKPPPMDSAWFRAGRDNALRNIDSLVDEGIARYRANGGSLSAAEYDAYEIRLRRLQHWAASWHHCVNIAEEFEAITDAESFVKN